MCCRRRGRCAAWCTRLVARRANPAKRPYRAIIELAPNTTVMVSGASGSGRVTALRRRAAANGVGSLLVNSNELSKDSSVFERQIRSIVLECRLHSAWPIFREADDVLPAIEHAMRMAQDVPLMASVRSAVAPRSRRVINSELAIPSVSERADLWRQTLPDEVSEECAWRYAITPGMIEICASAARAKNPNATVNDVHDTLRVHLERQLKGARCEPPRGACAWTRGSGASSRTARRHR